MKIENDVVMFEATDIDLFSQAFRDALSTLKISSLENAMSDAVNFALSGLFTGAVRQRLNTLSEAVAQKSIPDQIKVLNAVEGVSMAVAAAIDILK